MCKNRICRALVKAMIHRSYLNVIYSRHPANFSLSARKTFIAPLASCQSCSPSPSPSSTVSTLLPEPYEASPSSRYSPETETWWTNPPHSHKDKPLSQFALIQRILLHIRHINSPLQNLTPHFQRRRNFLPFPSELFHIVKQMNQYQYQYQYQLIIAQLQTLSLSHAVS